MERRKKINTRIQLRYKKMRRLCREMNRRRRRLRDKVDLLCKDLVSSNRQFTETLHGLRRAYDFQSILWGEFDLRYLLYKALREMKGEVFDGSAAIYLQDSGEFVAHLAGAWYEQADTISELEEVFQETLVRQVMETSQAVMVSDGKSWPSISKNQQDTLSGLSLLGLPVIFADELLGVVVMYRQAEHVFHQKDRERLMGLMKPLGQAISSVRRLQDLITQN